MRRPAPHPTVCPDVGAYVAPCLLCEAPARELVALDLGAGDAALVCPPCGARAAGFAADLRRAVADLFAD